MTSSGAIKGEIIPPGQGLTLIIVPSVVSTLAIRVPAPAGLTLAELALRSAAIVRGRFEFVASINGERVHRDIWRCVRPKPGTAVLFRAVPGDLPSTLSALVQVAGLAASFIPGVGPILGAAISLGGSLLVGALFPPSKPQLAVDGSGNSADQVSQTYSVTGGQNTADPFGVVAEILGRHRYYPKLGADWYTENVGADQYLRGLLVLGYGPKEISAIKIGETPIESFTDVQIEVFNGYATDGAPTLYPNEVVQDDLSIDITAAAGPQTRTTATNVDEISVDFVAPGGILRVDSNNAAQTYTVQLKVEYRLFGSTGAWSTLGNPSLSGRSRDQIRVGARGAVARGQYDVRVTKTSTDDGTDQVSEQVTWSALRGFRNQAPIAFRKPLALIAIRIKATSQLNGVIDSLNAIVATRCKAFDGTSWHDDTVSNNPADLFRYVLQGPANTLGQPDSRINVANLERWWAYCHANGFTCNLVCDSAASVWERAQTVASCGRAAITFTNGMWDVIWDEPDAPVVQYFTPRNSWGFASTKTIPHMPHGFRVRFVNEDVGYQQDERVVYDDGYNAGNATLFEAIEFPGVTDSDLIWRHGRFHIAQARLRPEQYTLNVDFEHLVATRGDRVRVTHDVPMWGLGGGRVLSTGTSGADDTVVLDEVLTMEADKSYAIRFRLADGTSILRNVTTDDGDTATLVLTGHGSLPAGGDLFMFGEAGSETVVLRILAIRPGADFSATLTLVDDAPAISLADQGAIPAFDSQITIPPDPFTAAPVNLAVSEAYEGVDGATVTGALFSWETVAGESPSSFEVEYRDDDGDAAWHAAPDSPVSMPTKAIFIAGLLQGLWSFRVRCIFASGAPSKWAELDRVTITSGAGLQLPNVQNVVTSYDDATATISWDTVKFSKLDVFYEVRKGNSWESGLLYESRLAQPRFKIAGNGTYWISAKAQPLPGVTIYSAAPSSVQVAGAILVRNVVATLHEHADGWDGVLSNCVIAGEVVQTTAANVIAYYELRAGKFFDIAFLRRMRIDAAVKAVGVPVNQNILADPDFLNNPDVLSAASSAFVEAWVEISLAGDLVSDVFAAGDVFASPDVFTGSAVFGDYQKYAPGEYEGRFFKLRVAFRSLSDAVKAALTEFDITGDVPDRVDHYTNQAIAAAGTTIAFRPNGSADPKPFKGGPGTDAVPHVQVTWNNTAGDELHITGLSLAGLTIQILNGGVPQDRIANIEVQGW